ncbi:hypothetical protein U1Q18_018305 [Sarracenia purpurea var. burkii]
MANQRQRDIRVYWPRHTEPRVNKPRNGLLHNLRNRPMVQAKTEKEKGSNDFDVMLRFARCCEGGPGCVGDGAGTGSADDDAWEER